jgi:LCP family protein required for cell wall assembly
MLAVTGSAGAFVAYYRLNNNIAQQDLSGLLGDDRPDKVAEPAQEREAENILLIGSDERRGKNARNVAGARSDTTILLHLAADRESAVLVSIPRDSMVQRPECTREDGTVVPGGLDMFNEAYALGGPACTIRTVESLTDIRIDHHVVVDFRGFKNMVDALGGVEVCLPQDVDDPQSKLRLSAGRHTVKGQQALAYVRTRKGLGNGSDLSRIDRQQAFLSSMVSKVSSTGLLLRPDRLFSFLDAATKSITTDPELASLNAMRKRAQSVRGLDASQVRLLTVPNETYPADPNRVQWSPAADALWRAIRFDNPLPGEKPKKAPTGSPSPSPSTDPLLTAPENIRVQVLNGSGVPGAASALAEQLESVGFVVTAVGNADRSDYATTEVHHDPAYDESGRTLGAALPGAVVSEDLSLGSVLTVVVGSDEPDVAMVEVSGATPIPSPTESLDVRRADQDICS